MAQTRLPRLDKRSDNIAGWRINTRLCESGANDLPIVMVHGLAMSSRYMIPTARELARDFRVYALDLPGFGESEKTETALSLPELTGVLRAWLETFGIRRALLLGNSMGCQIIANLVISELSKPPEQRTTAGAVLIGPTMDPRIRSVWSSFWHGVWNMFYEPPTFYPTLVRDYFLYGARRTFRSLSESFHDPIEVNLMRVDVPALVVRGEHDKLCSQPWAEEVTALLPQGRLAVIPGGAHVVNFDSPEKLGALVRGLVGEIQGA